MASRTVTDLIDDLDGKPADTTIRFAVNGKSYLIDLSDENVTDFHRTVGYYIDFARPDTAGKPTTNKPARARTSNGDAAAIRAWARDNGYTVADRGPLDQTIRDAYNAAQ